MVSWNPLRVFLALMNKSATFSRDHFIRRLSVSLSFCHALLSQPPHAHCGILVCFRSHHMHTVALWLRLGTNETCRLLCNEYSLCVFSHSMWEKGRDLTQSRDKYPYTHRTIQKATWQHKNATKNFDYTTIADRLRTVSWSNSSHPTGVVKPVYERSTFPLTATAV